MALYLLQRNDFIEWDQYTSFVVRAGSEEEARDIARDSVGDSYWAAEKDVTCELIEPGGASAVILSDSVWG